MAKEGCIAIQWDCIVTQGYQARLYCDTVRNTNWMLGAGAGRARGRWAQAPRAHDTSRQRRAGTLGERAWQARGAARWGLAGAHGAQQERAARLEVRGRATMGTAWAGLCAPGRAAELWVVHLVHSACF